MEGRYREQFNRAFFKKSGALGDQPSFSEEMITVISVYASVLGFAVTGTKANPGAENVVTYITPASTTFQER